jgi:Transcription factor S-II (TFIIS)
LHTVPSAVSDDPTLARSQQANCANCGHHEAVFFQSDTNQSDSLALIFVCCNCDHKVRSRKYVGLLLADMVACDAFSLTHILPRNWVAQWVN